MRILVVDDDPATATFMKLAFTSAGDTVAAVSTPDEAIRLIDRAPPDVVLTDLTFGPHGDPAADGFALVGWLRGRAETAHVGVLAVSGAGSPEILRAVEDRGFDGFVAKPVDVELLIDRVHRLGAAAVARRSGGDGIDTARPG